MGASAVIAAGRVTGAFIKFKTTLTYRGDNSTSKYHSDKKIPEEKNGRQMDS